MKQKFIAVLVVIAVMYALPCCGSTFRKISNQKFWDIVANGSVHEVIDAINNGANVNAKGEYSMTALIIASTKGQAEIVNALLKAGADINAQEGYYGRTALMLSAKEGYSEIITILLKAGANTNAKDGDGDTALTLAAWEGHIKVVSALLEAGADVNAKNVLGKTALINATWRGHIEIVNALLQAGADVNVHDYFIEFGDAKTKNMTIKPRLCGLHGWAMLTS